jgi:hypothetical protein
MKHRKVIEFVSEYIVHRSRIPQTLTSDQRLLLCQKRHESLLNYIRLNCSIPLHTMLRKRVKSSQVLGP